LKGSFTCHKSAKWDRQLYFPSEGRHAEDFFALKNLTDSAGFEPANLDTGGQHATPRPPKPLIQHLLVEDMCKTILNAIWGLNKHKAIPLHAMTGPEGSRSLRLPDFKTTGT
jgi:hypothetical protein